MSTGLGDEPEYGEQRPGEDTCLAAGEARNGVAPVIELALRLTFSVEKVVEGSGKGLSAGRGFDRVSKGHFFERKEKIRTGLNQHGTSRRLCVPTLPQERPEGIAPQ